MEEKKVIRNVRYTKKNFSVKDIIVVDIDKTIINNNSFVYKIFNIGFGKKRFISALRSASQKYEAKVFDFRKPCKKSILNSVVSIFNPEKYNEILGAVKNINKLSKDYYIFLLTSRPLVGPLKYLLSENIKRIGINVDFVIADCADKGKCCKMLNAKFLIDDSLNYCVDAAENKKTKAICFNDKRIGVYKNVLHLGDWDRIYDYIRFIDPLMEKEEEPAFTKWGLMKNFRENVEDGICNFKNVELSFLKNKENTK